MRACRGVSNLYAKQRLSESRPVSPDAQPRASTVTVQVRLFSDVRKYLPAGHTGPLVATVPRGATVAQLLEHLGIPEVEELTVGLNGELGDRDALLAEGDEVLLMTPMEGGAPPVPCPVPAGAPGPHPGDETTHTVRAAAPSRGRRTRA